MVLFCFSKRKEACFQLQLVAVTLEALSDSVMQ